MSFKVGQKIKIKSINELEKIYGLNLNSLNKIDSTFLKKRAGMSFRIRNVYKKNIYVKDYVGRFYFVASEIEKIYGNTIKLNDGLFEL